MMHDGRDGREDPLDGLLRDAARTYHRPPDERHMPLAEIWQAVDEAHFGRAEGGRGRRGRRGPGGRGGSAWLVRQLRPP
ncbi:MAG TPA: hypothetical protein VJU87_02305, partial [Gemmatimonadaceae bacterium]|nr:hypothetical protein [Gemmatimonadaceae bacterium]